MPMDKRALLIGINYINTPNQLQGCIYDIIEMKSLIVDAYGFNPNTIISLRDDDPANMPTRSRILQELQKLVVGATSATQIFLHYSGHGTRITDTTTTNTTNTTGTETDGFDECIVPCDYATTSFITDDEINASIKGFKGIGIAIFDSCRSGTIMDLPFTGITSTALSTIEGLYCFSGCQDNQDAVEETVTTTGSNTGLPQGAMTMAFLSTIRTLNYYPTISALYTAIATNLQQGGYSQVPQLTSTVITGPNTPFPYDSPNEQLAITQNQLAQQQALVTSLQAQIELLQPQATLAPSLQAQLDTLSVVQEQYAALQIQDASNVARIGVLEEQVALIPELQQKADLVPGLQNQVTILPALQAQIESMMSQVAAIGPLQNRTFELQNQNAQYEATIQNLKQHLAALQR
jgi:Caspase domain